MDEVLIRKATKEDLPTLLSFEQGIIAFERAFDVTLDTDPISYYNLTEMIVTANAVILVAEHLGKIIASGYALVQKANPYLKHKEYACLGFMFTAPEHRGNGINREIIAGLKEWAFSKGLKEIRLTVYAENENAIHAYEKVGFKKHIVEMRLAE